METRHFNPFTIRRQGTQTTLQVAARKLSEYPVVTQLLTKRFGPFQWHTGIDGSTLVFCFEASKVNLYQVTEKCGIVTVHILRVYDDTRIEADLDALVSLLREDNRDAVPFATLTVLLYLPHSFNVNVSGLLQLFTNQGAVDSDIHGTMLQARSKLYAMQWPLRLALADLVRPPPPPPPPAPAPISTFGSFAFPK